jgi:hypothetical protein
MPVDLENYDLAMAERALCTAALREAGSLVEAAKLLGITRHALKRRILKHAIAWPNDGGPLHTPPAPPPNSSVPPGRRPNLF